MPKRRKVSQTQIASALGVSQALVSLVLNGRRDGIHPDTYERIWKHALAVGYAPKGIQLAASPGGPPSQQVGFILRAPLRLYAPSVYFGHVQHGLHTALEARGYRTVFLGSEDELTPDKLAHACAASGGLHGVVLLGEVARPFLDLLRGSARRIVAVSARFPGLCHSVLGNEPQALEQLVRHLTSLGHRRFGWLGGNVGLGRHEARLSAFTTALAQAGHGLDPRYTVALREGDRAEGAEAVHRLLPLARRADFPTAFVTYNTQMALGAALAFTREKWRVPAEVSLASADVSRLSTEGEVRPTGAGTPPEKLGEAAALLLLSSTGEDDESFADLMLPAQLLVGTSTGPAPAT